MPTKPIFDFSRFHAFEMHGSPEDYFGDVGDASNDGILLSDVPGRITGVVTLRHSNNNAQTCQLFNSGNAAGAIDGNLLFIVHDSVESFTQASIPYDKLWIVFNNSASSVDIMILYEDAQ